MTSINDIVAAAKRTVAEHEIGSGEYRRFTYQNNNNTRKMGNNEYGCADAANILYTVGAFERDPAERAKRVAALRAFQHEDGLFDEGTHHPIHCTAHCIAALELFDAAPLRPLAALDAYRDPARLREMLAALPWVDNPWSAAHEGAGIYAAFILTGNASPAWQDAYFDWLRENADPETGIGFRGAVARGVRPVSHHLNGWFHYLFNFVFAHRPIPHAERAVDTCLAMYRDGTQLVPHFGESVGFAEIDWVYTLHRASAQEGYRTAEVREALRDFARRYFEYLHALDYERDDHWNDLHMLFGCLCAVAELQMALPGEFRTDYPLKLVLDRRPFI